LNFHSELEPRGDSRGSESPLGTVEVVNTQGTKRSDGKEP